METSGNTEKGVNTADVTAKDGLEKLVEGAKSKENEDLCEFERNVVEEGGNLEIDSQLDEVTNKIEVIIALISDKEFLTVQMYSQENRGRILLKI